MNMNWHVSCLLCSLPLLFVSCQTTEQIRKEKMMEDISQKISTHERSSGDITLRVQSLEQQLNKINGEQEEILHHSKTSLEQLSTRLEAMEKKMQELQTLQGEVKENRSYLEKVLQTLEEVQADLNRPASRKDRKSNQKKSKDKTEGAFLDTSEGENGDSPKQQFETATHLFQDKKYDEAKGILEKLVAGKQLAASKMGRILHHLGVITFAEKSYEESLIHFSKLYTEYPKSSFAPDALLHIGKILQNLGKVSESNEAFEKILKNYPNTQAAKEVKKIQRQS